MSHHRRGLRRALGDQKVADAVAVDWRAARLGPRSEAMLCYAEKLNAEPAQMGEADVEGLRCAGFGDAEVLAIAEVVGYYAFANRVVQGLGVELEDPD